jgi:hypothetical protein
MGRLWSRLLFIVFLIGLELPVSSIKAGCPAPETSSATISACAQVVYSLGMSADDAGTRSLPQVVFGDMADDGSHAHYPPLTIRQTKDNAIIMIMKIPGRPADFVTLGDDREYNSSIRQERINDQVLLLRIVDPVETAATYQGDVVLTLMTTDN